MAGESALTKTVNTYFGVLLITIAGSIGTLLIVRSVYHNSFYMMAGVTGGQVSYIEVTR